MRFWPKDHPDEIEIGDGTDFPPPFRPENAPGAYVPPAQITKEQSTSSRDGNKIVRTLSATIVRQSGWLFLFVTYRGVVRLTLARKRRGWLKRTLGLGNVTSPPPPPGSYDPQAEALQKLKLEAKKAPKVKPSGRFFDNQGKEPKSDQSSTASRPARAEPRTMHWTAALGVGGPGAGFNSPNPSGTPGEAGRRRGAGTRGGYQRGG
ncbi:hypothetical protein E4T42_01463 [Aureobasidium subglaciale]|nr:hypothetical protein E4T42_01463 [Aureobasidium subglaciale]